MPPPFINVKRVRPLSTSKTLKNGVKQFLAPRKGQGTHPNGSPWSSVLTGPTLHLTCRSQCQFLRLSPCLYRSPTMRPLPTQRFQSYHPLYRRRSLSYPTGRKLTTGSSLGGQALLSGQTFLPQLGKLVWILLICPTHSHWVIQSPKMTRLGRK